MVLRELWLDGERKFSRVKVMVKLVMMKSWVLLFKNMERRSGWEGLWKMLLWMSF